MPVFLEIILVLLVFAVMIALTHYYLPNVQPIKWIVLLVEIVLMVAVVLFMLGVFGQHSTRTIGAIDKVFQLPHIA